MKQFPKTEHPSLFAVFAGLVGMALQTWLFTTPDKKGLLVQNHPAAVISFLLLAVVIVGAVLFLKKQKKDGLYKELFPKSIVASAGSFLAAAGMAYAAMLPVAGGLLRLLVRSFGLLSAVGLAFAGYARYLGKRPNGLFYAVVAVFLIFRTLVFCQGWSAEVQVENYFFPLLGSLSLLMAAYYRAALCVDLPNCRQYLFFRLLALFCCLLAFAGGDRIFYLTAVLWMATDYCVPQSRDAAAE